ncbi:MAG TPA: DUF5657 family protein [Patescibacteria group bacterium]
MPNLENLNNFLQLAEKSFFVLGTIIYLIFATVVVKQTTTMTKNVNDKFNGILVAFSYIHLLFSVFLIILTLVIL